jgi:uncharacterized membrane protein YukC
MKDISENHLHKKSYTPTNQSVENQDANISKKSWMIWVLFGMIIAAVLVWRWKSKSIF